MNRAGFTLLELMAVLVLLGGFTALVATNLDLLGHRTEGEWHRLEDFLKTTRARSLATGREARITLHAGEALELNTSWAGGQRESREVRYWTLAQPGNTAELRFLPVNVTGPDRLVFQSSEGRERVLVLDRIKTVREVQPDE